jgi:hypothetical protein
MQVMAGKLKRADPNMVEDVTLIRALRDRCGVLAFNLHHFHIRYHSIQEKPKGIPRLTA